MGQLVENVFINVALRPSHGDRKCVVAWQTTPEWDDARFFVYRSETGAKPWENLTPDGYLGATEFEDDEFYSNDKLSNRYYRIYAEKGADLYATSPAVGLFDALPRSQYSLMRAMIRRTIKDCRRGNGLQVWHYMPLTSGEPNPAYDPETGQNLSSCPDTESFGLPFKGGYGEPVQTWIKIMRDDPYQEDDKPDGSLKETSTLTAALLAWPMPRRGHLIVHPPTGDFYVVDGIVKPFHFRGFAPIRYHVKLIKLRRSDPRYKVPVPPFENDSVTVA